MAIEGRRIIKAEFVPELRRTIGDVVESAHQRFNNEAENAGERICIDTTGSTYPRSKLPLERQPAAAIHGNPRAYWNRG